MAGCNENCNCFVAVDDGAGAGLDVTGDGAATTPYTFGVAAGFLMPMVGTSSQRAALTVADLPDGTRFYETDTSEEYVVSAGAWFAFTPAWIQSAYTSGALSAAVDTFETVVSVDVTPGYWLLLGKGNIEASTPAGPVVWTAVLDIAPDAVVADENHTSGNFENAGTPAASYARPFNLQSIFHATANPTTVALMVARDNNSGAQLFINCSIIAVRIPGIG